MNKFKEDILKTIKSKKFLYSLVILIIIGILSFFIMSFTFKYANVNTDLDLFPTYFETKWLMLMNIIPIFIIMILLSLIINKLWASFLITSILFFILSFINNYKLIYRDEPVRFTDFQLITESLNMAKTYSIAITFNMIIILAAILTITIILRKFIKFKIQSPKLRIGLIGLVMLITGLISKGFYFDSQLYSRLGNKHLINIWSETQQFTSKGLVYPFTYSIKDLRDRVLQGYDEERAKDLLEEKSYSNIPEEKKVNIIAIMLESYNDFSKFQSIEIDESVYEDFHNIQMDSYSGNLITNVFGGGTINTEWSFLTGYNSHPKYLKDTNSFIWYLNEQGYKTQAMHPNFGWFYNRRNVNNYLGFQDFDYYENKYVAVGEQPLRDWEFFDYIIKDYEDNKKKDKPYMNFSVTYQNHGPYSLQKETDIDYLKRQENDHEETYNMINNYFSGIKSTGDSLKKLIEYFEKEDEPTVVVLFGDHNPWLGESPNGYEMMGINIDLGTEEGFINYYTTPYVFWGNNSAKTILQKDFQGEGSHISPNFLMTELFQYLGWEGNEYMSYLMDVKDEFTVNHDMYFRVDDDYTSKLKGYKLSVWKDYNSVQYYYSRNFKKRAQD